MEKAEMGRTMQPEAMEQPARNPGGDDADATIRQAMTGRKQPDDRAKEAGEPARTFSQAEVDAIVSKRLERAREKWEGDLQTQKERSAQLATERVQKQSEEQLQKTRETLDKERAALQREKMELETIKELSKRQLPAQFAQFLLTKERDRTIRNVDAFAASFNQAVAQAVTARLQGCAPKAGGQANPQAEMRSQIEREMRGRLNWRSIR